MTQLPVANPVARIRTVLSFVWKIAPPLIFVLPLCVMPWDSTTLVWWVGCGTAAVISLGSLVVALRKLSRHDAGKPSQRDRLLATLRPALTIGLFLLAVVVLNVVENRAARQSDAMLAAIIDQCKQTGCPDAPQEWSHDDTKAWQQVGYWKLTYRARSAGGGREGKEFLLTVTKRTEDEECYVVGRNGLISHTHSVQCSSGY